MQTLELSQGYMALIDGEDYERANTFKWSASVTPYTVYAIRHWREKGKRCGQSLHRFITGVVDGNLDVDHKNGDGLDCRKSNLRICTRTQNQQNQNKRVLKHGPPTSRFKGVCYDKNRSKWKAEVHAPGVGGKTKYLGRFLNEHTAAVVYDIGARVLHGEFAKTNFKLCPLIIHSEAA